MVGDFWDKVSFSRSPASAKLWEVFLIKHLKGLFKYLAQIYLLGESWNERTLGKVAAMS